MPTVLALPVPASWPPAAVDALLLAAALAGGRLLHAIVVRLAVRATRRTDRDADDAVVARVRGPLGWILPLLAAQFVTPSLTARPEIVRHALALGQIAAVAWLLTALAAVVEDLVARRHRIDVKDNLAARRVRTQFRILRRVLVVVVVVVAVAAMLMTFPGVRQIGASLLASAGLAGLVVGFAARPVLANLIAGVQIALSQPIRIDDVVIVEGEWGRIEEITATYVVVRIWDERRLVVPLNYFNEKPFQNWTRTSADLLGTVVLWADYRVPVPAVREELHRILREADGWDGRVWGLQVTDATDRAVQLRALMSAVDSGTAWDLRCEVREKLLAYLREQCPESLPRVRAEVDRRAS